MTIANRNYRVLIVTAVDKIFEQTTSLFPASSSQTADRAVSINEAQRKISDRPYDLVIIGAPLPDDFGVRFAMDVSRSPATVAMLLVRTELYDDVYAKVVEYGVFVMRLPTSPSVVRQAFDWLIATRERLRGLEKKTVSLQDKMDEIRLVNRAKWALITHLNMTEEAAHRYLEKQAMDRCLPKRTIAEDILRVYKE